MLATIYAILVMLVLFSACIFVHELGHFWIARRCGLKIDRFSIGFGPALWKTTRDGIEYRISAIPFGGYVMLPQMNPGSEIEALEGKASAPAELLPPVAAWKKIIVALAGPAMNVALAAVIAVFISFHGIPSDESPEMLVVSQVMPDSPELAAGLRTGDRIVAVDGTRVFKLADVYEYLLTSTRESVPFVVKRQGKVVRLAIKFDRDPAEHIREPKFRLGESTFIRKLESGMPAEKAGLKVGDQIVSVNGEPVLNMTQFVKTLGHYTGQPVRLEVIRKRQRQEVTVTPFYDEARKRGRIGIEIGFSPFLPKVTVYPGTLDQLTRPVVSVTRTLSAMFHPRATGVTPDKLGGPPMIMYALTQQIKESLLNGLVWTLFLSVNLAILNLLPIPVLDGGHVMFAVAEWIRRKPLNHRFVSVVWTGCAAVLISFMVFISVKDVWQMMRFTFFAPAQTETNAVPHAVTAPPQK
ncbi:MAG: RIP metalloprotease RseP [Verrucomicrobia bacterium]|nr:RIP metalloprotease RseP [Verrucomicrobiota bacterium]